MAFLVDLKLKEDPEVQTPHLWVEPTEEMLSGSEMGIRDAPHPQDVKRPSVVRQFASEPHHHANYIINK